MRARTAEAGFTLMELIVAMLLMVLVLGGLVYAVTQLGQSNGKAMNDRAAQRQSLAALEQLRSDVRAARSPALDLWDGRRESLRELVRFRVDRGSASSVANARAACGGLQLVSCAEDVTFASGSQFWFRADVRTTAGWEGSECVGYVADARTFTRYLSRDWRGCGPGVGGSATVLLEAAGVAGRRLPANPFRYTLTWNPTMVPNQLADPADCRTTNGVASVPTSQRNYITSLDVDLTGTSVVRAERGSGATAGVRTSMQLTSRVGGDYAYAVGCSW